MWLYYDFFGKFVIPRPLKRGILGASTIILSKDIDKFAFMCGSNFNETDVRNCNFYVLGGESAWLYVF